MNMQTRVRPATLPVTALALAALLFAPARLDAQSRRPVVAILDFTNSAMVDYEMYQPFTVGIAGMLLAELRQNPDIELVERERLRQILDEIELGQSGRVDPETAARAGRILGVQHIIFGVFIIDRRENLRIDARAINVETSSVEHVETVEDDADNLLRAVQRLGRQLSEGLDLPARNLPARDLDQARRGQILANLKYARALLEEDRGNTETAVELYREFLADSPAEYATVMRKEAEDRIRELTSSQYQF
jgi:hypothetical protein